MKPYSIKTVCALLALLLCLSGCKSNQPAVTETAPPATVPTTVETTAPVETVDPITLMEELTIVLSEGEMYKLNSYPSLKKLDLSGSTCYEAILNYIAEHPEVEVTYTVSLGNRDILNSETAITLAPGDFDFDTLLSNLAYLPQLTAITLLDVALSAEQVNELLAAYPDIVLDYTVTLLGTSYTVDTAELDLSGISSGDIAEASAKLGLLTNLTDVQLNNNLSLEDVARLQDSNPNATFHYSFPLFGKSLSTTDTEVTYKNQNIGNDGEADIRRALAVLDNCERFVLDNCKLDYEVLAAIREDFRDGPKVIWRIYFGVDGRYNTLTDDDTIRAVYNVTDDTCGPLRYCEDVKYMDIGHNEYLTDLSFVSYMPNIEVLIASQSAVKELTGFENCKKLTWLELAYCYDLENIDALVGCESLTYLNIAYSKVTSYAALDGLPLKRFMCLSPKATTEEQNIFVQIHPKPDCITVYYGYSHPYGYGWRYDDNGKTFNDYYKNVIRVAFNYDYVDSLLPKEE